MEPFGLGMVVVTAVVAIAAVVVTTRRKQSQAQAFASKHQLRLVDAPRSLARLFGRLSRIPGGSYSISFLLVDPVRRPRGGRGAYPVDPGEADVLLDHVLFGEFAYTTSNGKTTTTHRRGVFYKPLPASFPMTRIAPEGLFQSNDIRTEWDEFNKAFHVSGQSPEFVSALLQPRMQELLMEYYRDLTVLLVPGGMLIWSPNWRVEDYTALRSIADEFANRVVGFLWKDYG